MNCNRCANLVGVAASVSGTNLLLTPGSALSVENEGRVCFVLTGSVPSAGATLPVVMLVNGVQVPVYDKYGNILYGANLRSRAVIKAYYGTNGSGGTAHLQLVNFPYFRCGCMR